jgi:hypothetical protein
MLDPPINAIGGGAAALWALYPAIDILHMNDNPIVECGGLEVDSGGIDVTGDSIFRNQLSTLQKFTVTSQGVDVTGNSIFRNQLSTNLINMNDGQINNLTLISSMSGTLSISTANITTTASTFIHYSNNPTSYDAFKVDLNGANLIAFKSTVNSIPATVVQNSGGGQLLLGTTNPVISINGASDYNVGIGTLAPTTNLQVVGTISTNNLVVSSITTNETSLNVVATNVSTIGNLNVTGDIYALGNITAGSDLRFKTNISTLVNPLSTVKNMTGVSYNMIINTKNTSRQIGLIAQEVERVLPEVVFTDSSPEQFKSVSYGNIVAILIEAVKELSDKVDNLEKLIDITK